MQCNMRCQWLLGITDTDHSGQPLSHLDIVCLHCHGCLAPHCAPYSLQVQVSREVQRVRDYEAMQLRCYQVGMVTSAAYQRLLVCLKYVLRRQSSCVRGYEHAASCD